MQAPLKDKNDIKIFILYLMKNVGYPLDFPDINDIVVQDGLVNYFDFAECFAELLDTGNISEIKPESTDVTGAICEKSTNSADNAKTDTTDVNTGSGSDSDLSVNLNLAPAQPSALYSITEQGKQVAESLQSDLMMMIREKSLRSAMRLLSFKKRGAQVKYSVSEHKAAGKSGTDRGGNVSGGYDFHCTIIEAKSEIMNLTFFVENKKLLDRIIWNFENKPETVYRGILAVISGEINYLIN